MRIMVLKFVAFGIFCGCVPKGTAFVPHLRTFSEMQALRRMSCLASRRSNVFSLRAAIPNPFEAGENSTEILRAVGATGNLRFKSSKVNPVDSKRDEPNFKVKPRAENPAFSLNNSSPSTAVSEYTRSVLNNQDGPLQARFENLVDFPCKFQIKVVGSRQGEFVEDILDSIGLVVNKPRSDLKHSFRDNGKWRSITVEVPVQSANQLYDVYAAIDRDPRVKFKF